MFDGGGTFSCHLVVKALKFDWVLTIRGSSTGISSKEWSLSLLFGRYKWLMMKRLAIMANMEVVEANLRQSGFFGFIFH